MFCNSCGTENDNDVKFCKNCGKPFDTTNDSGKNNYLVLKKIGIISVFFIGLFLIISIVVNASKTINLNDYLVIEANGYNSRGQLTTSIDWNAINEKYGSKISFTSTAKNEYGILLSMMTPVEGLQSFVDITVSEDSDLANGDTVEYKWKIDENLSRYVKCKVKYMDGTYKVSGLQEISMFDPFDGVSVEFSGVSPSGKATLIGTPEDNGLYYSLDNANNVSNGDVVTAKVSFAWESEESYLEKYKMLPSVMTKDFVVEGLDEYITSYTEIGDKSILDIRSQAEDVISSYVAQSYSGASTLGELEYMGYIFCGPQSSMENNNKNILYVMFRGNASNTEGKFDSIDVFFPVKFCNFVNSSGVVNYESCNGIVGSSYFSNNWYSTKGYTNPYTAYADLVEANKSLYSLECGDGFEKYAEYSLISNLDDIDGNFLSELEEKAKDKVISYIATGKGKGYYADDIKVVGEYLLIAKNSSMDFAKNNRLIIVLSGKLDNGKQKTNGCEVYYPIVYKGVMKLPDKWMYMESSEICGHFEVGIYYTKGYLDANIMFNDLVTSNRDNYTYQVSEGLKKYGE